jgi:hypothetical protein
MIALTACFVLLSPRIVKSADLGDLINCENTRAHSREYRKALGIEFSRRLKALDAAIPSPTPDEAAWLDAEKQRVVGRSYRSFTDAGRDASGLFSSRPALLHQAKQGLQSQLSLARCVAEDSVREMTCLAKLSHALMDSGTTYEAVGQLARQSHIVVTRDSGMLGMTLGDFDHEFWPRLAGQGILRCILTPYIESREAK